jgi:ABC-type antimicrobial peptide transport system permease subunit
VIECASDHSGRARHRRCRPTAVMLANVADRRQEISVRIALGASAADVLRLITRQGLEPTLVGLAIGVVVSLATN